MKASSWRFAIISAFVVTLSSAITQEHLEFGRFRILDDGKKKGPALKMRHFYDESFIMGMSMSMPMPPVTTQPTASRHPASAPSPRPSSQLPTSDDPSSLQPTPTIAPATSGTIKPSAPTFSPVTEKPSFPMTSKSPVEVPVQSPSPTSAPSTELSVPPSVSPLPSLSPSSNPTPTLFQEELIFGCTPDGVNLVEPPLEAATVVDFQVGYLVESSTSWESYQAALEDQILISAVEGALQCVPRRPGEWAAENDISLPMNTSIAESLCFPEVSLLNDCVVLETTFQVVLAKEVDPEVASFRGLVSLQDDMDGTVFLEAIPDLDRIKYVHPLPLLPPISTPDGDSTPGVRTGDGDLGVTSWTVGAVLAMCIGGVIALWVWTRNRATRNRRHMHLLEETSIMSPDQSQI